MKKIFILLLLLMTSCATEITWYESGQLRSYREGFITWSDGDNKNLPLSHISVNGINAGLSGLKK